MQNNFNDNIESYANLIVKTGINIRNNQILVISSPIECADFTRIVAEKAYQAGAREVVIRWNDEKSAKLRYEYVSDEVLDEVPQWLVDCLEGYSYKNAAFLSIDASDPDLMKSIDPKRLVRQSKARNIALRNYSDRMMSSKNAWCVVSVPTIAWAKKVFPNAINDENAMDLLWDAIIKAVRADEKDSVLAWKKHQSNLDNRIKFLMDNNFKSLHYKNSLGTDVIVELPKNHIWFGGGEKMDDGHMFVANMPTEEVFSLPKRDGVNGKIVSSMPLNYNGNIIDKFWFEFKDGKVVDFDAKQGKEILKQLIETDEGASRLGEVALVPHDSPISNMGILFYNTLFDENASCHFALGKAYPICIKNGDVTSVEELIEMGANDSLIHVDFMVGTDDLNIVGTTYDDREVTVFKNGNFVFE